MSDIVHDHLAEHQAVAGAMNGLEDAVRAAGRLLCDVFQRDGIVYTFGNGGSAADAQHLTGELAGHFRRDRRPLPAVTLSADPSVLTCVGNDYSFTEVFSRQVTALARPRDLVIAFTTTGRSPNVVAGLAAARANRASTMLFGGGDGGPAREYADLALLVPSAATPRIQEMHTLILHAISDVADAWAAS